MGHDRRVWPRARGGVLRWLIVHACLFFFPFFLYIISRRKVLFLVTSRFFGCGLVAVNGGQRLADRLKHASSAVDVPTVLGFILDF
ncbi:hypothetical protein [Pandoravirus japonicus]|uniref:Uncharacterized protein n=1 Tax=Pandoravirus japonicus TaxID=2823154 RepID=A0A811BT16_9VIRU|nr:hypothetical protein [Pandoravirus japonicus]